MEGWKEVSTLPYNFYIGSAVILSNEIHILGGYGSGNYKKHYKYSNDSWTEVSTLPYNFYDGSAVVLDDEIHILGGGLSGNYTKHYKYSNGSWTSVSTLPYDFIGGSAVVLDDEIHILGSENSNDYKKHYKYSNGSWTEVSTLPYNFFSGSAVVLDGEIHILGSMAFYTKHYKYSNGSWTSVSTLPYEFYGGSAVVLDDEIHILGSNNSNGRAKHYKYSNGSWTSVSTLPYDFYGSSAVVLDGEIHILGSYTSGNYTKHYKYGYYGINKVVYGNQTLIDLTSDTVAEDKLLEGYTAHDKAGNNIIGSFVPSITGYDSAYRDTSASIKTTTITGMNGKKLLAIAFTWSTSSSLSYKRLDGLTVTGGTMTKVCNLLTTNANCTGTVYYLEVTSDTCVVTSSANMRFLAIEATGGVLPSATQIKIGTFQPSTAQVKVTGLGFKPKYLAIYTARTNSTYPGIAYIYNKDWSDSKYMYGPGDSAGSLQDFGSTSNYRLYSIDDDGFTINGFPTDSWRGTGYYFAIAGESEDTTLWTNPDASAAFSAQDVQLSDYYTNYTKIRFYYNIYVPNSSAVETYVEYAKEEIDKWGRQGSITSGSLLGSLIQYYSSYSYARPVSRSSSEDNKFYIFTAGRVNGSGTGASVCVPTKIVGIR